MTTISLSALQLNELKLLLAGAYGNDQSYCLPSPASEPVATLLVERADVGDIVELRDSESTPLAKLLVSAVARDARGTWVHGRPRPMRPIAAGTPGLESVLDPAFRVTGPVGLLFGRATSDQLVRYSTVVVVDNGDEQRLADTVRAVRTSSARVAVVPRPASAHLDPEDARSAMRILVERLLSVTVDPIDGSAEPNSGGAVVLFTGLSGSGKSTIAKALARRLREASSRRVTVLDGDEVRTMLSSELGYSRRDRIMNVRRIGWVAAQMSAHGGIAICAPIAPYDSVRQEVRAMARKVGKFVLVYVDTPLEICEERDPKGLYAKARAGLIPEFTGISDPYEIPVEPDFVLRGSMASVDSLVEAVLANATLSALLNPP